jgi:hypothetical protein
MCYVAEDPRIFACRVGRCERTRLAVMTEFPATMVILIPSWILLYFDECRGRSCFAH